MTSVSYDKNMVIGRIEHTGGDLTTSFGDAGVESHITLKDNRKVTITHTEVFVDGASVYKTAVGAHGNVDVSDERIIVDGNVVVKTEQKRGAAGAAKSSKKPKKDPAPICESSTDLTQLNWQPFPTRSVFCDKCLNNMRDVLFHPCRHVVLCIDCVREYAAERMRKKKPIRCRRCDKGIDSGERAIIFEDGDY
jgi:hypothetical protein